MGSYDRTVLHTEIQWWW